MTYWSGSALVSSSLQPPATRSCSKYDAIKHEWGEWNIFYDFNQKWAQTCGDTLSKIEAWAMYLIGEQYSGLQTSPDCDHDFEILVINCDQSTICFYGTLYTYSPYPYYSPHIVKCYSNYSLSRHSEGQHYYTLDQRELLLVRWYHLITAPIIWRDHCQFTLLSCRAVAWSPEPLLWLHYVKGWSK